MPYKVSIHTKYALIIWLISIILVFIMLSVFYFVAHKDALSLKASLQNQYVSNYELDHEKKIKQLSGFLSHLFFDLLYELNIEGMDQFIEKIKSEMDVSAIKIADSTGKVLTEGTYENASPGSYIDISKLQPPNALALVISKTTTGHMVLFPIGLNKNTIGYGQVEFSDKPLADFLCKQDEILNEGWSAFSSRLFQTGLIILLVVIAVSIIFSVVLSRRLSAPLKELQNAAMAVYNGKKSQPIPVRGNDEFSNFIRLFNEMTAKIANYTEELEISVKERTRELDDNTQIQQVINNILKIAIEPTPLKEKLQNVL
ncbi:MAG: HAMP domain-containing protein [Nitrospirae bacterium YQR-1]